MKKLLLFAIIIAFFSSPVVAQITIFENETDPKNSSASNFMSNLAETQSVNIDDIADPGATNTEPVPIVESIIAIIGLGCVYSLNIARKKKREIQ